MPTVYSSTPYYDDYDQTKKFYRILFRPGRAVQGRELTQLQTLIQAQVERFGQNIFKEGSLVIPGDTSFDTRYNYVKLTNSFNSVATDSLIVNLTDSIIVGRTSGLRALVVNYTVATSTDPSTIFVKYLNSGVNNETAFAANEIIDNEAGSVAIQVGGAGSTGQGSAFTINEGVLFTKGSFVYFDTQTKILSKYSTTPSLIVGFDINETVITSDDDESLLDPAVGSFNYFAPGADRYKIDLVLNTREFTPQDSDDANFVELARVESGELVSTTKVQYNILGDTLARRTYDESGDYTVRPYRIKLLEHLRSTNANSTVTVRDGLYTAAEGGNSSLFVSIISPGKAYVKGYEIDSIRSKYINVEKARDFVAVNNGTVATPFGNYVYITGLYSIPDLSTIPEVDLYNTYTSVSGSASGTKVGTARVRHIEFYSGTYGTSSAVFRAFLFDIEMLGSYVFEKDVKQLFFNNTSIPDFTSNISPVQVSLTGTVSLTNATDLVTGSGTRFLSELSANDYITVNSNTYRISNVVTNNQAYLTNNVTGSVSGLSFTKQVAAVNESNVNTYIFEFPYPTIKTVDSTNLETIYTTKRFYTRTLSGGNVSITAGTDEVFSGVSTDNYAIIIASGANSGQYINPTGNVTRSGSPTGKVVTLSLSSGGYTTEDIALVTTIQKTQSAADRKLKTLVSSATVDFTTKANAESATLALGKADVYILSNVKMSANAFGTAYLDSNAVDITSRYNFDNGQRATFYDLGSVTLKPGAPKPTGPVRVTFDYFTHGSGDYFSVESYQDIDYDDIPSFTNSTGKVFQLRDCLDFRPRINDAGTGFTSTGSSTTEFLDFENDVITDYEYYLPRTDKIVLDRTGRVRVVQGVSSLNPKEPLTPEDSMALYVLKQDPYVFNLTDDVEIIPIDNKRYTMRDIGRIENRVKNLEYYTSLSLAEKETQLFQIKDALGFDRFKNGFVVDSFKGHGIGDVYNRDYAVAIDFNKNEARPLCEPKFVNLVEEVLDDAARSSNGYVLKGDVITVAYTEEKFITNNKSSKTVNLNPYNVILFSGKLKLTPPSDVWFDTVKLPDVFRNVEGNYDSVLTDARAKGTYGTVWGSWRDLHYGNGGSELIQQREGTDYEVVETIDTTTNNDVVISKAVIPKMRDAQIRFDAQGLKPNTRIYPFFNNIPVENYVYGVRESGNAVVAINTIAPTSNALYTDLSGNVSGIFSYSSNVFDLNTGVYSFRITDSSTNLVNDQDTFAEALYTSSGELINVANEIVSTRNARINSKTITDTRSIYIPPPEPTPVQNYDPGTDDTEEPAPPAPPSAPQPGLIDFVYKYAFGREPDPGGYAYWSQVFAEKGITSSTLSSMSVSDEQIRADGGITATVGSLSGNLAEVNQLVAPNSYNREALQVYDAVLQLVQGGREAKEYENTNSLMAQHIAIGSSVSTAEQAVALQIVTAIANSNNSKVQGAPYGSDAAQARLRVGQGG